MFTDKCWKLIVIGALLVICPKLNPLGSQTCVNKIFNVRLDRPSALVTARNLTPRDCLIKCIEMKKRRLCDSLNYRSGNCEIFSPSPASSDNFIVDFNSVHYDVLDNCPSSAGVQRNHQIPSTQSLWGQWSTWSMCNQPCGGKSSRYRRCNGNRCTGSSQENKQCNCQMGAAQSGSTYGDKIGEVVGPPSIAREPQWETWASWTTCSATCGAGTRTRHRRCIIDATGSQCDTSQGGFDEVAQCQAQQCASWSQWSQWAGCSATCGSGSSTRYRTCSGAGCPGNNQDTKTCSSQPCCGNWGIWGQCNAYCGSGTQTRTRKCGYNTESSNQPCTKQCAMWSNWSQWGTCSATCGNGQHCRTRTCSVANQCQGNAKDTKTCSTGPCPAWSAWNSWSQCSQTCGTSGGYRRRYRACSHGRSCTGKSQESNNCQVPRCAEWQQWQSWSACDKTCGSGGQYRRRSCSGQGCPGQASQNQQCNTYMACPRPQTNSYAAPQRWMASRFNGG